MLGDYCFSPCGARELRQCRHLHCHNCIAGRPVLLDKRVLGYGITSESNLRTEISCFREPVTDASGYIPPGNVFTSLVPEGHARHAGATSFEIRCKGAVVMDVENAPSRVLIRMPADARWRAPDIERLRISFERWLDLHQSQGRLLVESAGHSWVEARFGRFNGLVLDEQRCLFGAPGRRQPHPTNYLSAEVPS